MGKHTSGTSALPLVAFVLLTLGLALKLIWIGWQLTSDANSPWPHERAMVAGTIATTLLLVAPLVRARWRLTFAFLLNAGLTFVALADLVNARFYDDVISVTDLAQAGQVPAVLDSVVARIRGLDGLLLVDLIAAGALLIVVGRRRLAPSAWSSSWWAVAALVVIAIGSGLRPAQIIWQDKDRTFELVMGRRQLVTAVGLVPYHAIDLGKHLWLRVTRARHAGERLALAQSVVDELDSQRSTASPLFGVARGRNLILIQVESLQAFPVGLVVDGQPIMPNLAAFASESLSFPEFYEQTGNGATADGVFAALQSWHPTTSGVVATLYPANRFRALPHLLREDGYTTLAAIGAKPWGWNFGQLFPALGFEKSYFERDYPAGPEFGQGLSDEHAFRQDLTWLRQAREPFMALLVSVSSHYPYDLRPEYRRLALPSVAGTIVGDYLQAVHYFDVAFGQLLTGLRDSGLADRSIVALYGDHQAWLGDADPLPRVAGYPREDRYRSWKNRKRVPLLVRLPHASHRGPQAAVGGQVDIAPTLLSLLGVTAPSRVMFGRDLTAGGPGLVVFGDGSFFDGTHALVGRCGDISACECRDSASGRRASCESLVGARAAAGRRLAAADAIITGDLLPQIVRREQ